VGNFGASSAIVVASLRRTERGVSGRRVRALQCLVDQWVQILKGCRGKSARLHKERSISLKTVNGYMLSRSIILLPLTMLSVVYTRLPVTLDHITAPSSTESAAVLTSHITRATLTLTAIVEREKACHSLQTVVTNRKRDAILNFQGALPWLRYTPAICVAIPVSIGMLSAYLTVVRGRLTSTQGIEPPKGRRLGRRPRVPIGSPRSGKRFAVQAAFRWTRELVPFAIRNPRALAYPGSNTHCLLLAGIRLRRGGYRLNG